MSKDFLTDEEMSQLELSSSKDESPDFISDEEMSALDSSQSNIDPLEIAKPLVGFGIGGAAGYGVGRVARPIVEKGVDAITSGINIGGNQIGLDPLAELLAYRGGGGQAGTKTGRQLNASMIDKEAGNISKGIEELSESGVFDQGVTPRSVGREILDKKLLGPAGIGTKAGNAAKAKANLNVTGKPTNQILNSIEEYPIFQNGLLTRMKEILGYDELNPTVPDQANLKNKLDLIDEKGFSKIETPMEAENAKRALQRQADVADPEKTVKNAMNVAQSTARKEAVEKAVENSLSPEKLAEFRQLKARSGSAAVASDLLSEVYDRSQKPFEYKGLVGTGIDYITQRGAGVGSAIVDTGSKILKKGAKEAPKVGFGIGSLIGALGGAAAADEQTDSADFIPGLDQASPAGSAMDDKMEQSQVQALKNYENSPAAANSKNTPEKRLKNIQEQFSGPKVQDLQDETGRMELDLAKADNSFKNGFAYQQATNQIAKNKAEIERLNTKSNTVVDEGKALNKASPDQLMELSQSFQNIKGADRFVAPLENAAQSSSDEERQARLFGLYQQPAFRQLLKKNN